MLIMIWTVDQLFIGVKLKIEHHIKSLAFRSTEKILSFWNKFLVKDQDLLKNKMGFTEQLYGKNTVGIEICDFLNFFIS